MTHEELSRVVPLTGPGSTPGGWGLRRSERSAFVDVSWPSCCGLCQASLSRERRQVGT